MTWAIKHSKRREFPVKATFLRQSIRSDFVLNRLRNTKWEDREPVLDLIRLERHVLEGARGMFDAMAGDALSRQYPDPVAAIEAELLSADELAARERKRENKKIQAEEARVAEKSEKARVEEKSRREWLVLGGKA
jgi:hypothetical protein